VKTRAGECTEWGDGRRPLDVQTLALANYEIVAARPVQGMNGICEHPPREMSGRVVRGGFDRSCQSSVFVDESHCTRAAWSSANR
jgi:hypothetical protein